jgi:DNA helicase TIP49 (TBP-interacting protein)
MDPISLVVAALVAGLTAGVTDTAKTAVMDMYQAFKARLMPKVESNEDAQSALVALEKKPDSEGRQLSLKEELISLKVDKDEELVRLAQAFLEQLDQKGAQSGKYVITIQNAQGTVIGDKNTVRQNFTNRPDKK